MADNGTDSGGVQALERMMHEYGDALMRTCYVYLLDRTLAEDAAQDTFIKAYKHLSTLRAPHAGSERAWLMRIAINTCKDYRRSAWFRHVDRKTPVEELPMGEPEKGYEAVMLADAVLALPLRLRAVVLLVYYQLCTHEEAAEILSISRSAVKSRLHKARALLHGALERWETDGT